MLLTLTIKNYITAEFLEIDFSSGTTAITGETGAGKSLILGAVSLALGGRADANMIRHGCNQMEVSVHFDIGNHDSTKNWLEKNDFYAEGECLLRRLYNTQGRSKGYINGNVATMGQLQDLGKMLVDIHNQHEHQSLLRSETHQALLDEFANAAPLGEKIFNLYEVWKGLNDEILRLESSEGNSEERIQELNSSIGELNQYELSEKKIKSLEEQHSLLSNTEEIINEINDVIDLCDKSEDTTVRQNLVKAISILNNLKVKPSSLQSAEDLFKNALIHLDEGLSEVYSVSSKIETDPKKFETIDGELKSLFQLGRKYKRSYLDLDLLKKELISELNQLSKRNEIINKIKSELLECVEQYKKYSGELTILRDKSAAKFGELINQQLQNLDMSYCSLKVQVTPRSGEVVHPKGQDTVNLLIKTSPQNPYKPLNKIVSGGELSRISLAIQVVASGKVAIPTTLFDEVDVGVSGKTSDIVGTLLKKLGEKSQVLTITHQAQVAAHAHHHMKVTKDRSSSGYKSDIKTLSDSEKVNEIARILGGAVVTEKTRLHAAELIALAQLPDNESSHHSNINL